MLQIFSKEIRFQFKFCDRIGLSIIGRSLSKFPNGNWSASCLNKLLKKVDHAVNEGGCCVRKYILLMVYFKC